ncbi:GlpM family protein [Enterobacter hormaechei]
MGLVIKAALGALVVLLIGVLAKTKNYYIAGLIPLFPTFALIAHYIVASERGIEALRATIVFGMWSIIPYFIYLLSLWYFTGFLRLPMALGGAVVCWSLSAWVLIFFWSRFHQRRGRPPSTANVRPVT